MVLRKHVELHNSVRDNMKSPIIWTFFIYKYDTIVLEVINMNIVIRKAKPEEAERIIDIGIEVWNTTYKDLIPQNIIDKLQSKDEERIERNKVNIKERQNTFVAEVDGKIVGYNSFGKTRDENFGNAGEIYAGYILDDYQGLGLGRKMAIECMKEMLSQGYTTLVTKCLVGNPSNEFHKSLGGVYVGQSEFNPMGIHVGKENIYFHEDLEKSLNYNIEKLKKKSFTL